MGQVRVQIRSGHRQVPADVVEREHFRQVVILEADVKLFDVSQMCLVLILISDTFLSSSQFVFLHPSLIF